MTDNLQKVGFRGETAGDRPEAPDLPDRYRLVRRLGRGSMGVVHLARDRVTGRLVALKLLDVDDPVALERFRRESLIAGRLGSRSIVKIFELAEGCEQPYIAMQYVDGGNLADRDLELPALLTTVRDVARALARAHEDGIVHRDIKPENVLLDREGRAYLTDFGLARDVSRSVGERLSVDGQITGTPWCMSPEQARGTAVDGRSDIFSLGATLYAKLTGQRPFQGETVIDTLHSVLHRHPPRPRALGARVPRALEGIVMRCLEKDPGARFQTMLELVEAIDGLLAPPRRSGPWDWLRRLIRADRPNLVTRPSSPPGHKENPMHRETLDHIIYGVGSHVHVLDALETVDLDTLGALPGGAPHSIFQIVEHMRYWQDIALARIRGEPHAAAEHAEDGWTAPVRPADEAQWEGAVSGLARGLRALEEYVEEAFDPAPQDADRSALVRQNLRMVRGHDSYHLGQIVMLRQQLDRWPPPKGGDTW